MSLFYYFFIREIGYFHLGRFVDLFQIDLIILFLILILIVKVKHYNWLRRQ